VDLKACRRPSTTLIYGVAAQAHGGTAATAQKNNQREERIVLSRKLAH